MNTEGISNTGSVVDLGVQYEIITKAGAFFKVGDQNIQGREAVKKYFKENPKVFKEIQDKIWQKVRDAAAV
jgi:recombination protein RecA